LNDNDNIKSIKLNDNDTCKSSNKKSFNNEEKDSSEETDSNINKISELEECIKSLGFDFKKKFESLEERINEKFSKAMDSTDFAKRFTLGDEYDVKNSTKLIPKLITSNKKNTFLGTSDSKLKTSLELKKVVE